MAKTFVKVGSGIVGLATTLGTVAGVERVTVNVFLVTFEDGSKRYYRFGQTVTAI